MDDSIKQFLIAARFDVSKPNPIILRRDLSWGSCLMEKLGLKVTHDEQMENLEGLMEKSDPDMPVLHHIRGIEDPKTGVVGDSRTFFYPKGIYSEEFYLIGDHDVKSLVTFVTEEFGRVVKRPFAFINRDFDKYQGCITESVTRYN